MIILSFNTSSSAFRSCSNCQAGVETAGKKRDRALGPCYWCHQCSNGRCHTGRNYLPVLFLLWLFLFVPCDIRDRSWKLVFLMYDLNPSSVLINLLLRLTHIISTSASMLSTEVFSSLRSRQNFTHELVLTKVLPRAYSVCV